METMEFNLLREPWVRVRTQDGTIRTVSLTDALLHAHAYVDLAGEMPTQDAAMLRLLLAVLHVQQPGPDGEDISPQVMQRYRELLSPGSYLAISHLSDDGVPPEMDQKLVGIKQMYDNSSSPVIWRSRAEIGALFGDFEMMEPGMSWTYEWHPEDRSPNHSPELDFSAPEESVIWAGVG